MASRSRNPSTSSRDNELPPDGWKFAPLARGFFLRRGETSSTIQVSLRAEAGGRVPSVVGRCRGRGTRHVAGPPAANAAPTNRSPRVAAQFWLLGFGIRRGGACPRP